MPSEAIQRGLVSFLPIVLCLAQRYNDENKGKRGLIMHLKLNGKLFGRSYNLLGIICISITFFFFMRNISYFMNKIALICSVLSPFIGGFVLAYILIRPLRMIESILESILFRGKWKSSHKRVVSIVAVIILLFSFVYLLSSVILPQLLESLKTLSDNLPEYITALRSVINEILIKMDNSEMSAAVTPVLQKVTTFSEEMLSALIPFLLNFSVSITSKLLNVLVILAVSIYTLYNKERFAKQVKRSLCALMPAGIYQKTLEILSLTDETFGRYISGQLIDAIVVGGLCSAAMQFLKLPYSNLVGVIVACTNVIPMLGPFIGAIPSAFIILMAGNISQTFVFILLIFVLQQIDGNILVPRIVGNSTGLSGFWVLFAVMVGGGLFGVMGVILSVPSLSVMLKLYNTYIDNRLKEKGFPSDF